MNSFFQGVDSVEVDMIKLRITLSSVSHFISPKHLKLVFYLLGEVKGTLDK